MPRKGVQKEFRVYRGISRPRVNQEVVPVRDLEKNKKLPL